MFQTDQTLQKQIFAFTPRDLVAEDSDVWLYIDLFDELDLSLFDSVYSRQGQLAKEPRLMLRTLFYALTHGIVSGHKLQEVCRNDNRFITLSGDLRPDRRTFDRFVKRHSSNFDKLFLQIVRLAQRMGLVKLGRVAIDGSKFKAAADKSMAYEKMPRAMEYIEENLKKLKEDLARANSEEATELETRLSKEMQIQKIRLERIRRAKEQIEKEFSQQITNESKKQKRIPKASKALADPEALAFGNSAKFSFGYNVQAAVDESHQIIVAAEVHHSANDSQALPRMLEATTFNCQATPKELLADAGYQSLVNIKEVQKQNVQPVIAVGREYENLPEKACEQVIKDNLGNYRCLNEKKLIIASRRSDGYISFKMSEDFCKTCSYQNRCKLFGKKKPEILADDNRKIMNEYLKHARSQEFETSYRRRKVIVEPVFANIKNKGMKIWVRGKHSVSTWWKIACSAHNLEKMVRYLVRVPNTQF